jgi:hypothetical protein
MIFWKKMEAIGKWIDKLTELRNKMPLEEVQILSLERRREKKCSF